MFSDVSYVPVTVLAAVLVAKCLVRLVDILVFVTVDSKQVNEMLISW